MCIYSLPWTLRLHAILFPKSAAPISRIGGNPRGTPAFLINDEENLTIFHTCHLLNGSQRETYFIGAMTFSSRPPFRAIRISSAPIVHRSLYEGPWMAQRFDYVNYPMGFLFAYNNSLGQRGLSNEWPAEVWGGCRGGGGQR